MEHIDRGGELGINEFFESRDPAKHAELLLELQYHMNGQESPGTPSSAAPEFSARSCNRQPAPAARGGGPSLAPLRDMPVSACEQCFFSRG
jgi:hypothetical protein